MPAKKKNKKKKQITKRAKPKAAKRKVIRAKARKPAPKKTAKPAPKKTAKPAPKKTAKPAPKKTARPAAKKKAKKVAAKRPRAPREFPVNPPEAQSGRLAGDLQGLPRSEDAEAESVAELVEEGNAFEAGILSGVEAADAEDANEVETHEVSEDDVPGEYLDEE